MARRPKAVDLPALPPLDRSAGPLARQLAQSLREAVRGGDLKPGDVLPSSRLLAKSLSIARGTVVEAFEQLIAEGVLEARPGAGTAVSRGLSTVPPSKPVRLAPPSINARATQFAQIAAEFQPSPAKPFAVSATVGGAQPDELWRKLGNRLRARGPGVPSGYADPQGVPALRQAVSEYLRRARAVHCEPGQVVITSGIQQGLFLACQVLLDAGDTAWVEDPAYPGLTAILRNGDRQIRMSRIPVDDDGMDVGSGVAHASRARAAFVTPSHQYPLGMPLSMSRRIALVDWAQRNDAWIVEDDYDSEMRYAGHPFPSLQGLAPERVVYLGTFSKVLFPSLRLGYAVLPKGLEAAFCGARVLMDRHAPTADQYVLAAFIADGHLERHIRRIRSLYAERRAHLVDLIERVIPRALGWLQPSDQGMHVVLWLCEAVDDRLIAAQARERGVAVRAVSPMYSSGPHRQGLILGLGDFKLIEMKAALQVLVEVIGRN